METVKSTKVQTKNITEVDVTTSLDGGEDVYIKQGDNFRRVPLSVLEARINYKPITVDTVTVLPNPAERGSVLPSVTVSWSLSKVPTALTVAGQEVTPAKTGSVTVSSGITGTDQTFTVVAVDERGHTAQKSATLCYYNRIYWFAAADFDAEIPVGGSSVLSNTKARTITVNAEVGEYIWYVLPHRLGTPTFAVGGFEGGFSMIATETLTNGSGYSELYNIYRSDNAGLGTVTVTAS